MSSVSLFMVVSLINFSHAITCVPADLGLADGRIAADHITVSSQDPTYNKAEIGNTGSKKGWCPSLTDHSPWVQIKLNQPKAVREFDFMWSGKGSSTILTEFELQYIAAVDSTRRLRTFATDIPTMNDTHIFTLTIEPAVVTDTIRIIPSKWHNRPCFKLEILGCDPKVLCSASWCMSGGTCMGENVCMCPSGFIGSRCEKTDMMTTTSTSYRYSEAYTSLKPTATTTLSVPQWRFEDAIRANCTSSGWNISMDLYILQALYPGITANDIYLSSAKCHGTRYNNKLWFQQRFNTCMTTEKDLDGKAIFQNSLFYAVFDPIDPTNIRRHVWTYNVACYISKQESASAHLHHEVEIHSTNITGHHDIALTFYRDPNFFHLITGDPLRVSVGDNIYVKVATSIPDFDTKMRLHTCFTRPSDKAVEHLLIRDGCEVDNSTHIISQSTHETKFVILRY